MSGKGGGLSGADKMNKETRKREVTEEGRQGSRFY